MSKNAEVIRLLNDIADLLELEGESDRFKVEAYRRAARSLESLGEDITRVASRGALKEIPGIGSALGEKVQEYLASGRLGYYERLRARVPEGLLEVMKIPGVGPKTTRRFLTELGVESPTELSEAIAQGRLNGLRGFGERKIERLREGLAKREAAPPAERIPLLTAWELGDRIVRALKERAPTGECVVAGSLRRGRETIGDVDVLATAAEPERVLDAFTHLEGVTEVRLRGGTKSTVLFAPGVQVDLRVVPPESWGAALQYFTGSKDHNIHLRSIARDRGLKINEYGVFRGTERVAGRTEEDVYAALDLPWIAPELREDRGEVELAQEGKLPALIEPGDLQGDLHVSLEASSAGPLEPWHDSARRLSLGFLGVLLPATTRNPARVAGELGQRWEELGARPAVALHVGLIRTASAATRPLPDGVSYWAMAPGKGTDVAPPPGPPPEPVPLFLTGLPPPASAHRAEWVHWAHAHGVGLEANPRPGFDGLDAGDVGRAREAGVGLFLTAAAERPEELARLALAVRVARRGSASRSNVATSRPFTRGGRPAAVGDRAA